MSAKEALVLRNKGKSYQEIAELLNITKESARQNVHRARHRNGMRKLSRLLIPDDAYEALEEEARRRGMSLMGMAEAVLTTIGHETDPGTLVDNILDTDQQ